MHSAIRLLRRRYGFVVVVLTFIVTFVPYTQVGQTNLLLKLGSWLRTSENPFSVEQKQQQQWKRDWHNYEAINTDLLRSIGLGEFGKGTTLRDDEKTRESLKGYGFNVPLSEMISEERALPDVRDKACQKLTYSSDLPKASIIIVSYNEERSVLMRTLYSVVNRTPEELLAEILLVDDNSDAKVLGYDVHDTLRIKFGSKLRIIRSERRIGLIRARILGARNARGKVLVFLDAHVEATHNWLPPLLDPIVENPKTCTTPIIDTIHFENFAYIPATPARGGFNWQFNYVQLPLLPAERARLPAPHANPVMNGGLFAIAADFFWHLGAYDEQLEIWGGEQFELSFKIWMCRGRLLEVPCARVGHLYRSPVYRVHYTNRTDDFIARNYKRVAEVWLDSYKDHLYEHIPKLNEIDPGNLSKQKALRRRLKCKSFKWFLQTIAPDLTRIYPPLEPLDYADGALQSVALPELCLDSLNQASRQIVQALQPCSPDLQHPYATQHWYLSFRRDLRNSNGNCLEVQSWVRNAPLWLWPCHNQGGNQFWYYDRNTQLLIQGNGINGTERRCLEANIFERRVYVNDCDFIKPSMKWRFGYVNQTAMDSFFKDILY